MTFEGADGVGKTTQITLLAQRLREEGCQVLTTREPGGTTAGERVREILLDPACQMGTRTEALLYLAVRAEHVDRLVAPALSAGKIVICDRFSDSTLVYQGIARGLAMDKLAIIDDFATGSIRPDLTIVLDAPPELLADRMAVRGEADRMEQEGIGFQKTVREGFLALAAKEPGRMFIIDATKSIDEINQAIYLAVKNFLTDKS